MMTKIDTEARIRELLDRPYRMVVRGDPTEGYLAEAPELPGCLTAGETAVEAMEMLRDAMAGWFEEMLESGLPIPEPEAPPTEQFSGKILVRTSPHFHRALVERARSEGVSLNQWMITLLARGMPHGPLAGKGAVSWELMASPNFGRTLPNSKGVGNE
jgi:antitoxin HicB